MRIWYAVFAVGLTIACDQAASAQQQVYAPINPSFGGNPFNSSHLLGIANAQNKYKDPSTSSANNSQANIFASELQSRLLSALSSQITDAIFGQNAQQSGTVTFGDQTIAWNRGLDEVTLTITNNANGQVTTIQVPTIINVTGGGTSLTGGL